MIITTTETPIETSGMNGTAAFGIQQSRKAFKILSGLYSDIHLAIVRELSCNALDSHSSVGKSHVPFHIHLPNDLEPWITIEDFGSGIAHKDIYEIYAVYFASTKANTNSQIGCMGLGSKSPFALTDTFTVQSTVDGERRIYNAFFDEKGMPSIALMSTENTKESNGVKIQIPVKRDDFSKFADSTKKACRFFDVKPTISGGKIVWNDEVPTFVGDGWRSYESFNSSECFCVMGGVTYPVDIYKLDYKFRSFLQHTGLVMFFEMGELDFTPSRESLEYGEDTIKALTDKVEFIESNFAEKYNENIQNKPNILEALRAVYLSERKFSFMSQANQAKAAIWNGIDISMPDTYVRKLLTNSVTIYSWQTYGRSKYRTSNQFTVSPNVQWYVDDLNRGTEARIKKDICGNEAKKIMVVSEADKKALIAAGFPDIFTLTSTLPKVSYNRGTGTGTGTGTAKVGFKIYALSDSWRDKWESEDYDPADVPTYYIVKDGNTFDFNVSSPTIRCNDKSPLKAICNYLDIKITDVVMVGKRGEATLVAAGSKPFADAVKDIKVVIDPVSIATKQDGNYAINHINDLRKGAAYKSLSDTHPFKVYAEKMILIEKECAKYAYISSLINDPATTKAEPLKIVSTDPIIHILTKNMDLYSWDKDDAVKIMAELEKREKEILTLKQLHETL